MITATTAIARSPLISGQKLLRSEFLEEEAIKDDILVDQDADIGGLAVEGFIGMSKRQNPEVMKTSGF